MDRAAADADVAVGEVEDAGARGLADHGAALGVRAAVRAADVEHPAVGRRRDAVRLAGVRQVVARAVGQARARVVGRDRRLAAATDEARGPLDAAQQVLAQVVLGVCGRGAAHAGVEAAATLEVTAPGDRRVGAARGRAVAGRGAGRAVAGERVDRARRARGPRVPDVIARPLERQITRRGVHAVAGRDDLRGRGRRAGGRGARTDQPVEERVAGLGLRRGADADEAAATLDVALQRTLLRRVQAVARAVEKDDRAIGREVRRGHRRRVRGRLDAEAVRRAERRDGGDACVIGGVGATVEHEHLRGLRRRTRGADHREAQYEQRTGQRPPSASPSRPCVQQPNTLHRYCPPPRPGQPFVTEGAILQVLHFLANALLRADRHNRQADDKRAARCSRTARMWSDSG